MNLFKKISGFLSIFILVGSLVSCDFVDNFLNPINAKSVVGKESLIAFVNSAISHLENDYDQAIEDFKTEKRWKRGSIYLFISDLEGRSVLHVSKPSLEGTSLITLKDRNGVHFVKKYIEVSQQGGGGFVEYIYDHPEIADVNGSLKIGYGNIFTKRDGTKLIVGSGFYPL